MARKIIIKGLTISMGWNLGKKSRLSHLFDPLTSVPKKGTKNRRNREIKNKKTDSLNKLFSLKDEKNIKIITPKKT